MKRSPLLNNTIGDGREDETEQTKVDLTFDNETADEVGEPEAYGEGHDERPVFYTPSMMLQTMNDTMGEVGGSVELKRKLDDGTLVPAQEGEKKAADLSAKMRQSAEEVLGLEFDKKVAWAGMRKAAGNKLFQGQRYQEAMDIYMTALVAISNDLKDVVESDEKISLPILLNLSMCALNLGNAGKAVAFCNHALSLESGLGKGSHKVYFRRGKGRIMTGDYKAAKEDFKKSLELCEAAAAAAVEGGVEGLEGERKAIQKELQKLQKNVQAAKVNKKKVKAAMTTAVERGNVIEISKVEADRAPAFKKRVSKFNSARKGGEREGEGEGEGWVGLLLDYVCCRRRRRERVKQA
ncbi:hypothetical protein TrVE_jg4811 [Triparma verrucosa]|uniref:Uncharacterized protein n=1 Tax=Triparma verrucosa TaxID=1606542 RepID=A0A9W7BGI8_9STRA|nr:hypothetical protein TrVE_jg4811 [Triparma verrucosa]